MTEQASLFGSRLPEFATLTGTTVGVDEVGRGPLVGEVVASAVILPVACALPLQDSKKLSAQKREQLAQQIKQQALAYSICSATPDEIDQLNILQASLLAMQRAVAQIVTSGALIKHIYVDGNRCPDLTHPCQFVVKGDAKVAEISAASILAKVYRDKQMLDLHQQFPHYGFNEHKGYPTKKHLAAIEQFGIIPGSVYRKSFQPVKRLL